MGASIDVDGDKMECVEEDYNVKALMDLGEATRLLWEVCPGMNAADMSPGLRAWWMPNPAPAGWMPVTPRDNPADENSEGGV